MFRELKEYQDIIKLYQNNVYQSEEINIIKKEKGRRIKKRIIIIIEDLMP